MLIIGFGFKIKLKFKLSLNSVYIIENLIVEQISNAYAQRWMLPEYFPLNYY